MRRSNFLPIALATAIVGLLGGVCDPVSADPFAAYRLGGGTCLEKFPGRVAVKNLKRLQGKLVNVSTIQAVKVSCPLAIPVWIPMTDWTPPVSVAGSIRFQNSDEIEQTFRCDIARVGDDGEVISSQVKRKSIGPGEQGSIDLAFDNVLIGSPDGWPVIECTLRPQSEIVSVMFWTY